MNNPNIEDHNRKAWSFIRQRAGSYIQKKSVTDGVAEYTYEKMFACWEKYAAVFSALGMTGENRSRVGLLGSTSAEAIFAFYGLNMVGAEVSLLATFLAFGHKKIIQTIKTEQLTDIILTDDFAQPGLISELMMKKTALGLKNIILLHIPFGGSCINGAVILGQEYKYQYMRQCLSPICMDTLLEMYSNHPIVYAEDKSSDTAVIIHTSGTTSGMGKPIPLSDSALNSMGLAYDRLESFQYLKEDLVCALTIDLSNSYGIVNQVHAPLAVGGTVAAVPAGSFNPLFYKAVPEFKITLLFCTAAILEVWQKQENPCMDFSSLRCVVIGGAAVSAEEKHRCCDFLCRHGGRDIMFINGYGLSELGGACILSTPDIDDSSIGYVMPGVEFCLYNEDDNRYYTMNDVPCCGILYLRSDTMTGGFLDSKEIIRTETISDKKYVCSNDLVSVDQDGKINYLGRANRYFINNDGIKYEAGRVETEISQQTGIESCGIVPYYVKITHDNVPMLCVNPMVNDFTAAETVRMALLQVFVISKTLGSEQLPQMAMLTDELPRNANGKIDFYRLGRGKLSGQQFKVKPVRLMGQLTDILLLPVRTEDKNMVDETLEAIAKDIKESSASFFNTNSDMEETDMKQNFNPIAFFNMANQMGSKMMGQMCGNAWNNQQGQPNSYPFMMFGMPQQSQMPQMPMMFGMPQAGQMQQMFGMPQMEQMNRMMAMYANQMYMMTKQTMEMMYQQQMQMLEKMNEVVQKGFAGTDSNKSSDEETVNEE